MKLHVTTRIHGRKHLYNASVYGDIYRYICGGLGVVISQLSYQIKVLTVVVGNFPQQHQTTTVNKKAVAAYETACKLALGKAFTCSYSDESQRCCIKKAFDIIIKIQGVACPMHL